MYPLRNGETLQEEILIECPYCGERITVLIDPSVDNQSYVEDCSVCCRPIQFQVVCADGSLISVVVTHA